MKKTLVTIAALIVGVVLSFLIFRPFLEWLVSVSATKPVAISPSDIWVAQSRFAIGCGILFATVAAMSRSIRQWILFLAVGILMSFAFAAFCRAGYVSATAAVQTEMFIPMIFLKSLPLLKIPLVGTIAVVCLALGIRSLERMSQVKTSHDSIE